MSFKSRWNSKQRHRFAGNGSDDAHQTLNDRLLNRRDPWHGDERERHRKRKMPQPRRAARRSEKNKGDRDDAKCVQPAQQSPIRISNFKKPNRKEQQKRNDRDPNRGAKSWSLELGIWSFRSRMRLRRVFPPQPEKHDREKRNEPAVAVLIVHRPFAAQLPPKNPPKRREEDDDQRHSK